MTRIKICGMTNLDDALCAAEAGADMLGFIFYRQSPRFMTPERAAAVAQGVRDRLGGRAPRLVGVFVNAPLDEVRATAQVVGMDLAQLHGHEPPEVVSALAPKAFKALRPRTLAEAQASLEIYAPAFAGDEALPQLLVDAYHPEQYGGTGQRADLELAAAVARLCRLLLAGGLTPDTVGEAIRQARPWGVDVSSGVEASPGIKDHALIRAFAAAVRAADGDRST